MIQTLRQTFQRFQKNSLIKNALAYVSGDVLQKALNFILVPIWVRFLTPDDYGIYGTLVAYTGMATALMSMGLHAAIVRNYYDYVEDKESQRAYVTTIMYFLVGMVGLIVLALNQWGANLWELVTAGQIPFDPFVRLTLLTILGNIINQTIASVFQAEQKAKQFLVVQYSRFAAVVVLTFTFVIMFRWGALGMIAGQALGSVLVAAVALFLFGREWFVNGFRWDYVQAGLTYGLPLVPHTASLWILQSSDRIVLEYFVSLEELGIYNLGYTLGLVLTYLVQGINRGWAPYFYRLVQNDDDPNPKIKNVAALYFSLVSVVCLIGVLFANELVHLLFPETYYASIVIVGPVLFGAFMAALYLFVSKPLWYLKLTNIAPRISISAAIINIGLNIWLIPIFGAIAAAWTTAISYFVMFVCYYVVAQRHFPIPYQRGAYAALTLVVLFVTMVVQTSLFQDLTVMLFAIKLVVLVGFVGLVYTLLLKKDGVLEVLNR